MPYHINCFKGNTEGSGVINSLLDCKTTLVFSRVDLLSQAIGKTSTLLKLGSAIRKIYLQANIIHILGLVTKIEKLPWYINPLKQKSIEISTNYVRDKTLQNHYVCHNVH